MLLALMVMPRSRSRSMESSTCSCISRCESAPVISSRRSASVDLPWSMCAMMQKFRWNCGSMYLFCRRRKVPQALRLPKVSRWEHRRTARNRNLGTNSLPQIAKAVSRHAPPEAGPLRSAAKLVDDPEYEADQDADDQAGHQREVERGVPAAMDDVPGQAAEAEGKLAAEIQQGANDD